MRIKKQKRKIPDFGGRLSNCWRAPQACGRKGVSPCTLSLGHHCIPIQCTGTGMYFHLSIKCLKTGIEHFLPISSLVHALHSDLLHQAVFFLMLFPCWFWSIFLLTLPGLSHNGPFHDYALSRIRFWFTVILCNVKLHSTGIQHRWRNMLDMLDPSARWPNEVLWVGHWTLDTGD